jgi:hypothetical protein
MNKSRLRCPSNTRENCRRIEPINPTKKKPQLPESFDQTGRLAAMRTTTWCGKCRTIVRAWCLTTPGGTLNTMESRLMRAHKSEPDH